MRAWAPTGRPLGACRQAFTLIWIARGFHGALCLHVHQDPTILQSSSPPWANQNSLNFSSLPAGSADLQANEVVSIASLFDSPQCKQSIMNSNFNRWKAIVQPPNPAKLGEMQQTYYIQKYNSMYVRNQKAGSNYLVSKLHDAFNSKVIKDKALVSGAGAMNPQEVSFQHHPPPDTLFTVISHPAKTAVAGYLEVSARNGLGQPDPLPAYRTMPCGSPAQDMARYKTFLRAVHDGTPLGPEAFHVFPQALKVDIDIRRGRKKFDFIAKLDNLRNDMQTIASRIGVAEYQQMEDPSKGEAHSTSKTRCRNVDFDDQELAQMMCELYMPDYVCFGYDLPAACRSQFPSNAPHSNRSLAVSNPMPIGTNGASSPMQTDATSMPMEGNRTPPPMPIGTNGASSSMQTDATSMPIEVNRTPPPMPIEIKGAALPMQADATSMPMEVNRTPAPAQISPVPVQAPAQISPIPVQAQINQTAVAVPASGAPMPVAVGAVPTIDLNDTVG